MNDPRHGQPVLGAKPVATLHPQPQHQPPSHPGIPAMPIQPVVPHDLEPIGLEDELPASSAKPATAKITAFGVAGTSNSSHSWKRTPHVSGQGICRVKSFHGRLSDQGMEYLDNQINEWLDCHPDVDVKSITTNTNLFDGKMKELALIVNIWY